MTQDWASTQLFAFPSWHLVFFVVKNLKTTKDTKNTKNAKGKKHKQLAARRWLVSLRKNGALRGGIIGKYNMIEQ